MRKKTVILTIGLFVVILVICGAFIHCSSSAPTTRTIFLLIASLDITLLGFFVITLLFGKTGYRAGIFNFFIGDEGTYSLSRLQAVAWAVIIISCQVSIILALFNNLNGNYFFYYQPVFSESAIMLLGLSLSSYIATKGITVHNIRQNPGRYKNKSRKLSWKDLLTGDNGLDFSRCQMLIWTILALIVFESKCYYFIRQVQADHFDLIGVLFNKMYNEYGPPAASVSSPAAPFVPYLPWTFVVLMGLSNGIYVGKKLVPTFKLDEIKAAKQDQLAADSRQLGVKKQLLQQMVTNTNTKPTPLDKQNLANLMQAIQGLETSIAESRKDIADISQYK